MEPNALKTIRLRLKISQNQLAGQQMTRNLISLIENGRAHLTPKTAQQLAQRINQLIPHSNTPIFPEDLLIPGRYQGRLEAQNIIQTIEEFRYENHFNVYTYIGRVASLFAQWDLPIEKFHAYRLIAECFNDINHFEEAHLYYTRAYETAIRLKDITFVAPIALQLSFVALKLEHYHSAIHIAEALKSYEGLISNEQLLELYKNQAVAFMALENYEQAIDSLIFMEHLIGSNHNEWQFRLNVLKCQCYINKGMLGIAQKLISTLEQNTSFPTSSSFYPLSLFHLKSKINPQNLSQETLQNLWTDYQSAPSHYTEQHLMRFLESAYAINDTVLFKIIAWEIVTTLNYAQFPRTIVITMDSVLKAWAQNPDLDFFDHWYHFLTVGQSSSFTELGSLMVRYLNFFINQNFASAIRKSFEISGHYFRL